MPLTKKAKKLSPKQLEMVIGHLKTTRYPVRNITIMLLSYKAGLRAKEIANITWEMVYDSSGKIGDEINLVDKATKGKSGRTIPINKELKLQLQRLKDERKELARPELTIIFSERGLKSSANSITCLLWLLYKNLGLIGCSSHSGRRTFVTTAAQKINKVGGSIYDVQLLAGHKDLRTTQGYIVSDSDAQTKIVDLI